MGPFCPPFDGRVSGPFSNVFQTAVDSCVMIPPPATLLRTWPPRAKSRAFSARFGSGIGSGLAAETYDEKGWVGSVSLSRRRVRPEAKVSKEILSYFLRNPHAADDLEGVARWRLLNETIDRSVEETRTALEWLVKQGFLLKAARPSTTTMYRLNHQESTRARSFLMKPGNSETDLSA
jgi:hypothetical protein